MANIAVDPRIHGVLTIETRVNVKMHDGNHSRGPTYARYTEH